MNSSHLHVLLPLLLLSAPHPGAAQPPAKPFTLAQALSKTLRDSPALAAFKWETRAAEARLLQAGLPPNPELSLDVENPAGTGMYKAGSQLQSTLEFRQLLELGGKRKARIAEATADRAVSEWDYASKKIEVLKEAALAFIDILAAQRRIAILEESLRLAEQAAALAEQRVGVGKGSSAEAIRARIAVDSLGIDRAQAGRDLQTALSSLAAQWGETHPKPFEIQGRLSPPSSPPSFESLRLQLQNSPTLARWSALRVRSEAALAREQSLGRPSLTLLAGPRTGPHTSDTSFVAGISLPLPLLNQNQGGITAARAAVSKAIAEQHAAEARAASDLAAAYQRLTAAQTELRILAERVLPGASDAERQLSEGYATGRFSQSEVLEARRTLNSARSQETRALADYHKARTELDALTATLPGSVSRHEPGASKPPEHPTR
jgi:cobalt-zinc-cadmium efflux system outer membrane protein